MSRPTISIITPTYNQAEFLPHTLASVRAQTYPCHEHIIMDAVSTDDTLCILSGYASLPQVKVVSEKDKGQSDAINKGIKLAAGEIVGWLNSDDVLTPDALEKIADAFSANPGAVVVYGLGAKMSREGETLRWVPFREFDRTILKTAYRVVQPAMFFRRDTFLEIGGLDIDLHYAMDWDLLIRLAARGEVVSINEQIARIRFYDDTKTSTGGWARMKEIAMIGRRHNGAFDLNYLSYCLRTVIARKGSPSLVCKAVDAVTHHIGRVRPVMVLGWPKPGELEAGKGA